MMEGREMKRFLVLCLIPACLSVVVHAQEPPSVNPVVGKILSEISESNIRGTVERLVSFGTRHTLSDTLSSEKGIGAARRWIKSEMERYASASRGRMTVEFHESVVPPSARVPKPTTIVNVVATLKPSATTTSDRILVVGGHYDSRASDPNDFTSNAPGANDDGSGTALTMELARVMAPYEFDATIVFIAFVGEEQGLLGAGRWAEMARNNGWKVEAVLSNDIVGSSVSGSGKKEGSYVRVFSEAYSPVDTGFTFRMRNSLGLENDGPSRSLARYVKDVAERYLRGFGVKLIYRRDRFLRGGDHSPFHERGFAAVRFSVAVENYDWQHQNVRTENGKEYGDLTKFMDFPYCVSVARTNAAVLATLGLAPSPPEKAGIVTSRLEYQTTLRWQGNKEADLAGYFVRYRSTSSPQWEQSVFTKDTTLTLDVLKDDYLFGVQAVDKEGNVSLPAIPRPVR